MAEQNFVIRYLRGCPMHCDVLGFWIEPHGPLPQLKKGLKKLLQKSAAIYCHCKRRALRVCSFLCVCPAQLP